MKELIAIQSELKAPKNQFNAFGKYKYRSVEDILEALKPLLLKYECTLTIEDEVKEVGGIVFIESTAAIQKDMEGRAVTAQAGIDINRKGMDVAQSFGSSSSYARKYALNGLFLIDDTKDPDSTNDHGGKKEELTPKHPKWNGAMDSLATGKVSMDQIKAVYILTKENEQKLKGYLTL
jgi:hypothetical protein